MIELLIGHLVGDYVLQNDWMAKTKSKVGFVGMVACTVHCILYAAAVVAFVILGGWRWHGSIGHSALLAFAVAFCTHYPIDRISAAKYWMKFYGQTSTGPFAATIYVAVDNTFHLALMYLYFTFYGGWV